MTYSQFDPAAQNRVPWNFGAKIGPKRPFNQKQIWAVRFFLNQQKRIRDRALFDLAIDGKFRDCDLVELKIGDLVNGPDIRKRAAIKRLASSDWLILCSLLSTPSNRSRLDRHGSSSL